MDPNILFTRNKSELIKLDNNSFYTLAWKDLEWMRANKSVFTKEQGIQVCQAGVVDKVEHGDSCSKPTGLYLAPGRSWIDFAYEKCRFQFYKRYLYKVVIKPEFYNSKIYLIDSHDSALEFTNLYGIKNIDGSVSAIKWSEVAKKYSGISILNWTRSSNKLLLWYNDFEASQLVIWNSSEGDLQFELVVDAYTNDKLFLKPKTQCVILGGKSNYRGKTKSKSIRKRKKTKVKRLKRKTIKFKNNSRKNKKIKRKSRKSTSRRARSRKNRNLK